MTKDKVPVVPNAAYSAELIDDLDKNTNAVAFWVLDFLRTIHTNVLIIIID